MVAERSAGNPPREPFVGNQDWAKRAQSEAVSSISINRRLADNDACHRITQNHNMREYGFDRDYLCNVIEDQRRVRARTPTPPRRSLAGDVANVRRCGFCARAGPLREVRWPDKLKASHIDLYDGYNNPKEFI
jgi:hypothetical protein